MSEPILLNQKQTAEYLGFSYEGFRKAFQRAPENMPKPIKVGTGLRWPRKAIDEWIEKQLGA